MTVQHSTLSYVAGVELVKQGDVEIGAHQQAETDLSKVAPFLLVVTRLREFRRGADIDVGEGVGVPS